jgi:hypothetical protein
MKFSWDQKVEFKKSNELYRQILLKVLTKVGIHFIHFAWTKVSKMKQRVDVLLENAPFPSNFSNWGKIKQNFADI